MTTSKMLGAGFVFALLIFGLVLAAPLCFTTSCTPAARSEADLLAVDLTRAVCSPADPLDQNPIVEVVCLLSEGAESVVAIELEASASSPVEASIDAGARTSAAVVPHRVSLSMRREEASAFCAKHRANADAFVEVSFPVEAALLPKPNPPVSREAGSE